MRKCEVCKRKVPLIVPAYAGMSPTLMCMSCFQRALDEIHDDTNFNEWKKKVREERKT